VSASSIVIDCPDLARVGPIVPIRIRSAGATHALRGLIDTGAARTVLGEAAAGPLRLARVGTGRLTTAGGNVHGWIGLAALGIGALPAHVIRVAVIQEVPWAGFDVLVGRDILSRLRLVFDGPEQRLVITG
jgi:predicted aspartyl protease